MEKQPKAPSVRPLRSTRRDPKRKPDIKPCPVTEVKNPCPVCHNTAHLQDNWRPETGYDRRMRQFKCMQGHEHYTVPRSAKTVLEPPI